MRKICYVLGVLFLLISCSENKEKQIEEIMAEEVRKAKERENAAKFSFFLSAPVVCGAVVLELLDKATWAVILAEPLTFLLGIAISFIIGLICIKYLLKYLQKHNFKIFMIYRVAIAIIVLLCTIL